MAGVIDDDGQQWEHCSCCNKFVKIQNLGYLPQVKEKPEFPYGMDLCLQCVNNLPQRLIRKVKPADSWIKKES